MADLVDAYPKKCFLCTNTLVSLDRTNNGHPLVRDEDIYIKRVCDECNKFKVLPARGVYGFVFWYALTAEQIKLFKELLKNNHIDKELFDDWKNKIIEENKTYTKDDLRYFDLDKNIFQEWKKNIIETYKATNGYFNLDDILLNAEDSIRDGMNSEQFKEEAFQFLYKVFESDRDSLIKLNNHLGLELRWLNT